MARTDLQFLPTGLLPTSPLIHSVTLEELREYFVERFPGSRTRAGLYDNFVRYLKLLEVFVGLHGVIINGSFVTSKVDPRDIDISPVIDGLAFEGAPQAHQNAVECLIDHSSRLPKILHCHPMYTVFLYPKGHARRKRNTERAFQESKAFWSRAKGGQQKGFLFLGLDAERDWR